MPFVFSNTKISDLTLITPHQAKNENGYFCKYFEIKTFRENGMPVEFAESNMIRTYKRGVVRGLHYQNTPSQARLFYVVSGSVFYVALDLRKDSNAFGQYESFSLSEKYPQAVYAPENFAHGFLTLEDNTIIFYLNTGKYIPENCGGILWNDNELNIKWPIDDLNIPIIISEKDRKLETFENYKNGREDKKFGFGITNNS